MPVKSCSRHSSDKVDKPASQTECMEAESRAFSLGFSFYLGYHWKVHPHNMWEGLSMSNKKIKTKPSRMRPRLTFELIPDPVKLATKISQSQAAQASFSA